MRHKDIYVMDKKAASETLKNVFAANNAAPNKTSLDTLVMRTRANTTLVKSCKWIAIVALFFVTISPLAFKSGQNFTVNNMKASSQVTVVNHELYDDRFEMVLSGDLVDYSGIYCKKLDGTVVIPTVSDRNSHFVEIPFDGDSLNIYIPCTDGKVVQAVLSK